MFYDRFKQLCDEKGISIYKAATDIGLNRAAANKWKNGSIPNGQTLSKLAEYFGVTNDYLLGHSHSGTYSRLFRDNLSQMIVNYPKEDLEAAGVNEQEIERIINGETPLSFEYACELSEQLGESINSMINENAKTPTLTKKDERKTEDDIVKFALFKGDGEVTDAMLDEVKAFAAFVQQREKQKKETK